MVILSRFAREDLLLLKLEGTDCAAHYRVNPSSKVQNTRAHHSCDQ